MTWQELKLIVDDAIARRGLDGTVEVWYIDITFPISVYIRFETASDGTTQITITDL